MYARGGEVSAQVLRCSAPTIFSSISHKNAAYGRSGDMMINEITYAREGGVGAQTMECRAQTCTNDFQSTDVKFFTISTEAQGYEDGRELMYARGGGVRAQVLRREAQKISSPFL